MTAPNVIQNSGMVAAVASANAHTLTSVVSGNTLVVVIIQSSTSSRTYTVVDSVNGSWGAAAVATAAGRSVLIFRFENSASGSPVITVTQSSTLVAYGSGAIELDASTLGNVSTSSEGTNTNTHYCAASGAIDTAANAIIISALRMNNNAGTITKTTGATEIPTTDSFQIAQYLRADAGFTDERSTITCSTARQSVAASAAFISSGGSPQSINVGIVTETESALTVSVLNPKSYTVALTTEIESALVVTVSNPRSYTVGIVTETESSLSLSVLNPKSYIVGIVSETESTPSILIVNPRSYSVSLATETESVLSVSTGNSQQISIGIISETESVLSVTIVNPRSYSVNLVSETESVLACSISNPKSYAVNLAVEVESVLSVSLPTGTLFPYFYYEN